MERDVLAERRARRDAEASGDPILVRRAETAEAAAQALEERLTRIQARLHDAEQECSQASERLGERERELRLASERLAAGEQELHAVTGSLAGRESELRMVSDRLVEREQQLQAVSERLIVREQELRKAELEIKSRLEGLEGRVGEAQRELATERQAREAAERELLQVRAVLSRTESLVGELRAIATRLRSVVEAAAEPGDPLAAEHERERRAEMSDALASAVERLRARVAAVGELHEQSIASTDQATPESVAEPAKQPAAAIPEHAAAASPEQPAGEQAEQAAAVSAERPAVADRAAFAEDQASAAPLWAPYVPRIAAQGPDRSPWLAQAIRRVAERRDARLAAELVVELLPAQAQAVKGRVRYGAQVAELGEYEVTIGDGGASVVRSVDSTASDQPDFVLSGPAAAFAEIAAGGAPKRPAGLHVRGRLRARRLIAARREPIVLSDLVAGEVVVWPGLLLLAMVEAIDPSWTESQRFAVAFEIEGPQSTTLRLHVRDGQPLQLVRAPSPVEGTAPVATGGEADAAQPAEVAATVRLSERAFGCMLAGSAVPATERVLIRGDAARLDRVLHWTDRVQGIRRLGE